VVIVGCGRVGAGLAAAPAEAGDRITVIDKDPKAFERLGEDFAGQTVEGIGFDRAVGDLEGGGGLRVVSITRRGGAFVPDPATVLVEGDVVRVAVAADTRDRLDALLAEEARREAAGREAAG
jgi:Trk K+ transport system NAD-binding subunit